MTLLRRLTAPGIVRLYLAAAVVVQHLGVPWIGALGVLLFFVLSGYWICTLWKVKYSLCRHPYLVFMLSRYWRLLPVYLCCVVLGGLCIWRFSGWWGSWTTHFTDPRWMLSNLLILGCAGQPRFIVPAWSLDVEMQFYLLAPAVIALTSIVTGRALGKAGGAALLGLCVAGFFRLPLGLNLGAYLIFFATGCVLAHVRWKPSAAVAFPCAILGLAVCLGTLWRVPFPNALNATNADGLRLPSLVCVALAVPLLAWSLEQRSDHLDRILGDLAYPVYLFHFIPFLMLDHIRVFHAMATPGRAGVDLLLVAIGSAALYFLIDRPIERKRRAYVEGQTTYGRGAGRPALSPQTLKVSETEPVKSSS